MLQSKHILVIDNNVANLGFTEKILSNHYELTLLASTEQALSFLNKNKPDLVLLEINMPEIDGFEAIVKIKENKSLKDLPVILMTAQKNSENEVKGLELGAVDFITKPFIPQSMLSRIKMHLELNEYKKLLEAKVEEKALTIQQLQDTMIFGLAELVECRDENTGGHVKRTAKYVQILAEGLFDANVYSDILTPEFIKDINRSAPLHDIGKIGINDGTLLKAGSLNEAEYEYIKKHAQLGGETLQKMIDEINHESFLYTAKDMAHYHHEKWDGNGYPKGLKGEEIPVSARIMAIADVYDALTTKRPYKEPFTHEEAVRFIVNEKSKMFDPKIVDVFEHINIKFKEEYIKLVGIEVNS